MHLYHTGKLEIRNPDIHYGRNNADFGQGFYLTPDRDFTYRWAGNEAVVNEYNLDLTGLSVYEFSRDTDWFQYIYHNRRGKDTLAADVIIGPIANDTIFDTLGMLSSGFLSPEDALQLLLIGPQYTQVAVKTEKAARQLRWLGAEAVRRLDEALRRKEQVEYADLFGNKMIEILDKH